MNSLLICFNAAFFIGNVATADEGSLSDCSLPRSVASSSLQGSAQECSSGVVLLSKRSALSRSLYEHDHQDTELSGVHIEGTASANNLGAIMGASANLAAPAMSSLGIHLSVLHLAKRSDILFVVIVCFFAIICIWLIWKLFMYEKKKHEIYDDDEDGWKHEVWTKTYNRRTSPASTPSDSPVPTGVLPRPMSSKQRQERTSVQSRGQTPLASQASLGASSSSSHHSQHGRHVPVALAAAGAAMHHGGQKVLQKGEKVFEKGEEVFGKGEKFVEGGVEEAEEKIKAAENLALRSAQATANLGKHATKSVQQLAHSARKKVDKHTGKALSSLKETADAQQARLQMRWDEARYGKLG